MKNQLEVEKMVGHKLCKAEETIFNLFKDEPDRKFYKDENGNLGSKLL